MSDQAILPGFRRWVGPEPKIFWTDGKGNPVEVKRQPASFYGAMVPVPHDRRGVELRVGPYRVLQRTDGRYLVYDERLPLGENSRYLAARGRPGMVEAVGMMVRYAREEGLELPVPPARKRLRSR